ncbi:MAG: four helix bundle protein [Deltaproteobacteria bacterium]|nr:four helix bundle protein [Deltaproteobacteria bacterium]
MRDPTKRRAFEQADRLALAVCEHTRRLPRDERFGLTAWYRRGAVSIPSSFSIETGEDIAGIL